MLLKKRCWRIGRDSLTVTVSATEHQRIHSTHRQDLNQNLIYNTEWKSSRWSEKSQTHVLTLWNSVAKEQISLEVEVLISANGPLSTPQIPKIPGLQSFKGVYFHNLRWDKSVDFSHKRVAVIGNGSSAVQFIVSASYRAGLTLSSLDSPSSRELRLPNLYALGATTFPNVRFYSLGASLIASES
jgi:cation diffusion facilitator CzcD-associated flavoprotein CzcO